MSKKLHIVILLALLIPLACASYGAYRVYSSNLFQGKQLMKRGELQEARTHFEKALESERLPEAFAFAATTSYKLNDMKTAETYMLEAEKLNGRGVSNLRIAGYKALIYLKEGRSSEGMTALQDYIALYSNLYPLTSIEEVKLMIKKNKVDQSRLETLLDEQITWYEDEIEQYEKTGTGFYDKTGTFRGDHRR